MSNHYHDPKTEYERRRKKELKMKKTIKPIVRTSKPLHPTEHNPKPSFRKSFAEAKKGGKRKFTWDGKTYNTQTAAEKAKKSIAPHLILRARKAAADVKKNPKSKSHKEIYQSYEKETKKRFRGASSKDIYKAAKPPL